MRASVSILLPHRRERLAPRAAPCKPSRFDPSAARTSLAWELTEDGASARHASGFDAPATICGAHGQVGGDQEVTFRLEVAPAGAVVQFGLCDADHLLDNALGWSHSLGVGLDGVVRCGRYAACATIGAFAERDRVTFRLRNGRVYVRRGPVGAWNGDPAADPERDRGGLPAPSGRPLFPAAYAEVAGTRLSADFSRWPASGPGPLEGHRQGARPWA